MRDLKKYKCGLYIGRFQPIHIGHEHVIRKMLEECETIVIAIGSAQEGGTLKNPFTFEQRMDLIQNVFYKECIAGRIDIVPVRDRENPSNDASWGDYVFKNVWDAARKVPDAIYEGEEAERSTWYDNLGVPVIKVSRDDVPVSATLVRSMLSYRMLVTDIFDMIPKQIRYRISEMRAIYNEINYN